MILLVISLVDWDIRHFNFDLLIIETPLLT